METHSSTCIVSGKKSLEDEKAKVLNKHGARQNLVLTQREMGKEKKNALSHQILHITISGDAACIMGAHKHFSSEEKMAFRRLLSVLNSSSADGYKDVFYFFRKVVFVLLLQFRDMIGRDGSVAMKR